ncbi:hypothetical protein C0993_007540 [Termitomyces sp. T159_Od127]|nr:hypothetical protein C0993_007540 [Termitomyces sp. T159_Od127]
MPKGVSMPDGVWSPSAGIGGGGFGGGDVRPLDDFRLLDELLELHDRKPRQLALLFLQEGLLLLIRVLAGLHVVIRVDDLALHRRRGFFVLCMGQFAPPSARAPTRPAAATAAPTRIQPLCAAIPSPAAPGPPGTAPSEIEAKVKAAAAIAARLSALAVSAPTTNLHSLLLHNTVNCRRDLADH